MTSLRSESSWYPWTQRGLWIVAVLVLAFFKGPHFISSLRPSGDQILDFIQEWASARNYYVGQPIYADQRISIERHLNAKLREDQPLAVKVNAHPPTSVLLVLPFALLDYESAFFAWNLVSLAAFALSLWLIARELKFQFSPWAILPLVAAVLVCGPLFQQFNQGQLNLILLPLIVGAWIADRRGWPLLTGSLLGAAAAIKLFPAFLGLYFLVRGKWRAFGVSIGSGLLLTVVTAGVLGIAAYEDYVRDAMPQVSLFRDWWANCSLTGFWCKLFETPSHHVIPLWSSPWLARTGIAVSCLLVVIAVVRNVRSARSTDELDLAFGATTVAMLLVSPITWDHYFLLLIPLLAILWNRLDRPPVAGWIVSGICLVTLVAIVKAHLVFLLMMIPAILIWLRQAPKNSSALILSVICIALCVSPKVIWDATIAGNDEMHGGVAQPIHALTVLSYQLYTLLGLFLFSLCSKNVFCPATASRSAKSAQESQVDEKISMENANFSASCADASSLQPNDL